MLRPIEEKDLEALEKIDSVSHPWYWLKARFREVLQLEEECGFICEVDGEVLGFLIGRVIFDYGEVLNITVAPDARRHGLAEMMMITFFTYCHSVGVKQIFLDVRENNSGAYRLYSRLGFRDLGKRHRYYVNLFFASGYEDSIAMVKDLSSHS